MTTHIFENRDTIFSLEKKIPRTETQPKWLDNRSNAMLLTMNKYNNDIHKLKWNIFKYIYGISSWIIPSLSAISSPTRQSCQVRGWDTNLPNQISSRARASTSVCFATRGTRMRSPKFLCTRVAPWHTRQRVTITNLEMNRARIDAPGTAAANLGIGTEIKWWQLTNERGSLSWA